MQNQMAQVPSNANDGNNPKNAEEKFSNASAQLKPESHSIIFCEMNDEPIAEYMKLLPQIHVRLDQDFYSLVNENH